jgi:hypothetical protein
MTIFSCLFATSACIYQASRRSIPNVHLHPRDITTTVRSQDYLTLSTSCLLLTRHIRRTTFLPKPTMSSKLHRVKLVKNTNYKRDGLKSYGYALRKYGIVPTQEGPFRWQDENHPHHQGKFGEQKSLGGRTTMKHTHRLVFHHDLSHKHKPKHPQPTPPSQPPTQPPTSGSGGGTASGTLSTQPGTEAAQESMCTQFEGASCFIAKCT